MVARGPSCAGAADYLAVESGGLTGAVAATRYVGGTASGAPTTGTFQVGNFVITQAGNVFICTVAGTPGTWVEPYANRYIQLTATNQTWTVPLASPRYEYGVAVVVGRVVVVVVLLLAPRLSLAAAVVVLVASVKKKLVSPLATYSPRLSALVVVLMVVVVLLVVIPVLVVVTEELQHLPTRLLRLYLSLFRVVVVVLLVAHRVRQQLVVE